MKKTLLTILGLFCCLLTVMACPVCEQRQPKLLKGITHGTGPESNWEWVTVLIMTAITVSVAIATLCYLLKPGEKQSSHIKFSILSPTK